MNTASLRDVEPAWRDDAVSDALLGLRYRRLRALSALAGCLATAGMRARVTEASGAPVLTIEVGGAVIEHRHVVCRGGWAGVDWFRWRCGDYLAPASEPKSAAEQITAA